MRSVPLQNILNRKTPSAQRNWKKALRGLVDHCLALKLIKEDPLASVKLVKMKTTGHHTWEPAECEQFEKHHPTGTRARLAYELLLQAGQSRCDVVRMGRQHVRNGMISLPRQKTGVPFNVEIMPRLQAAIGSMPGQRPPDIPGHGTRQALHRRRLRQSLQGPLRGGWVTPAMHLPRAP